MQYRNQSFLHDAMALSSADAPPTLQNEVRNALRLLRRRGRFLICGALSGAVLLGAYAVIAKPTFRATTQIALDPNTLSILDTAEERAHKQDTPLQDSARVDSLVQVLQSDATLLRVVKELNLQDDAEFNGSQPSPVKQVIRQVSHLFAGADPPAIEDDVINGTVDALGLSQSVERAAGTYIVTIAVLSKDPVKAATIANAFADDYLQDQLTSDAETTRVAAQWMKGRLGELTDQMLKTQGAVAEFKNANGIATADGKSIADMMLSDVSSKLSDAIAQTAQAKAKLDRIVQVNAQSDLDLSVTDALSDDVVTTLRKKVLDLQGRAANFAAQYGNNHAAVLKLRAEADVVRTSVRNELKRLEESSRSDYEIAAKNEAATRRSQNTQFLKTTDVARSEVKLQELDSAATTAQIAYEEALKRYTETVQKESYPMVQARIIARAVPPNEKFKPKTLILVAVGVALGLLVSLAYSLVSELFDKRIRSRRQVERVAGADCLGAFPQIKTRGLRPAATFSSTSMSAARRDLPWDYVLQKPHSVGAEAMRSIKVAFDQMHRRQGQRVLGITSSLPGEGKSTVAVGVAHLLSAGRARVLLVDADLRRPTLTGRLHAEAEYGLPDILAGAPYNAATISDTRQGIDFIAARSKQVSGQADASLGSPVMQRFLQEASEAYDYVILDLPPLLPLVDVREVASFVDSFVLVVAWGQTSEDAMGAALDTAPAVRAKLLGVLLNKVRLDQLARHGEDAPSYYSAAYHSG